MYHSALSFTCCLITFPPNPMKASYEEKEREIVYKEREKERQQQPREISITEKKKLWTKTSEPGITWDAPLPSSLWACSSPSLLISSPPPATQINEPDHHCSRSTQLDTVGFRRTEVLGKSRQLLTKIKPGTSLGGPVVKTSCFQCRGPRFNSWSGN